MGILVGVFYYVMTIRTNQRNQELTLKAQEQALETRQLDLYMKWQLEFSRPENWKIFNEVLALEWENFDDFRKKYDHTVNPDDSAKRLSTWTYYNGLGYLLSRGMIDPDSVHEMHGVIVINHWIKFEPIIRGYRELYGRPELWKWFEYLADEMKNVRERRGLAEYVLPEPPK